MHFCPGAGGKKRHWVGYCLPTALRLQSLRSKDKTRDCEHREDSLPLMCGADSFRNSEETLSSLGEGISAVVISLVTVVTLSLDSCRFSRNRVQDTQASTELTFARSRYLTLCQKLKYVILLFLPSISSIIVLH